jgi:GNAT superfamily N-acetyltransferase
VVATSVTSDAHIELNPYLTQFKKYFITYPAHLHINLTASAQGLGLGSKLLATLEQFLLSKNCLGLHLITGEKDKNVRFYERNYYKKVALGNNAAHAILLLGKKLVNTT